MEGNEGCEKGGWSKKYRGIKVSHRHHAVDPDRDVLSSLFDSNHSRHQSDDSFSVDQLKEIIEDSGVTPAVNQILFHPNVLAESEALLQYHKEHGIVTEGYSPIKPLRDGSAPGLVKVVGEIAKERKVEPDQVLLAWSKGKGLVLFSVAPRTSDIRIRGRDTQIRRNTDE